MQVSQKIHTLQAALFALCGFSAVMIPRFLPVTAICLGIASAASLASANARVLRLRSPAPLDLILFALILYFFVNALWATNTGAALAKAAAVLALIAAASVISEDIRRLEPEASKRLALAWLVGFGAGLFGLALLQVTGQPLRIMFHTWFSFLADAGKDLVIRDGTIVRVKPYRLNPNAANLAIFLLPSAICAWMLFPPAWRQMAVSGLILLGTATVYLSESETAKLAIVVGGAVMALTYLSVAVIRYGLVVAWLAATLLAAPLAAIPYELGWHRQGWIAEESAAARFYIWRFTAEKVAERPILGIGIRSTRDLQREFRAETGIETDDRYRLRPGRHAHNGYLQVWLELGALGAVLIALVGLAGLWRITALPITQQRVGLATFAVAAVTYATGWGLWQTWLLASLVLVWPMMLLSFHGTGLLRCR